MTEKGIAKNEWDHKTAGHAGYYLTDVFLFKVLHVYMYHTNILQVKIQGILHEAWEFCQPCVESPVFSKMSCYNGPQGWRSQNVKPWRENIL